MIVEVPFGMQAMIWRFCRIASIRAKASAEVISETARSIRMRLISPLNDGAAMAARMASMDSATSASIRVTPGAGERLALAPVDVDGGVALGMGCASLFMGCRG